MADETNVLTVRDRPSAPSLEPPESATSIATPQQALRLLEARRAWTFVLGLAVLCLIGIGMVLAMGGDPFAQRLHIAALGLTALTCFVYVAARRDPARYRPSELMIVVMTTMFANMTGFYYWGLYSAFLAVVSASAYAFSSGASRRGVIVMTSVFVVMFVPIGIAQLTGFIEQRGLVILSPQLTTFGQILLLVTAVILVFASIAGGLDTRAQMVRILDEHHAAQRELAQRDALLAEARQEVAEARAPGEGRHTGKQVGRFTLHDVLGRGAMGEVYAAVDDGGAPCAVKVLAAHLIDDSESLKRFHREARAIAGLAVPNIVRMIEVSAPGAALPYLAMEKLDGDDLGQLIKQRSIRELGEVVTIVRALAAGLDAAHEAGVVHRDLKPANVFAAKTPSGVIWKILDFGVSKMFDADATMTHGHIVGTPGYMAPEQARGDAIDRRADVYSLGVVAFRLLTGRPAIVPGDVPQMIHEVVFRMPLQPSTLATVPPAVEAVLAIALAKSPADRFASAGELAAAFAEAASGFTSPSVNERAAAILRRAPWGQWVRGTRANTRARTAKAEAEP